MESKINTHKIFLCGLSRTGKNSVNRALNQLGFGPSIRFPMNYESISNYQICSDLSIVSWMEMLVKDYPLAKWILTLRNIDEWILDCQVFFQRDISHFPEDIRLRLFEYRRIIYGSDIYDEILWRSTYINHMERTLSLLPKDKLLIIDFGKNNLNHWKDLQGFLNTSLDYSDQDFPFLNTFNKWEPFHGC